MCNLVEFGQIINIALIKDEDYSAKYIVEREIPYSPVWKLFQDDNFLAGGAGN